MRIWNLADYHLGSARVFCSTGVQGDSPISPAEIEPLLIGVGSGTVMDWHYPAPVDRNPASSPSPFSTTVRPVALSEVAQIIGYLDVLWHPVGALTAFPSSLHNVGQDFADTCYRFSAFPREVSYLFG